MKQIKEGRLGLIEGQTAKQVIKDLTVFTKLN